MAKFTEGIFGVKISRLLFIYVQTYTTQDNGQIKDTLDHHLIYILKPNIAQAVAV